MNIEKIDNLTEKLQTFLKEEVCVLTTGDIQDLITLLSTLKIFEISKKEQILAFKNKLVEYDKLKKFYEKYSDLIHDMQTF